MTEEKLHWQPIVAKYQFPDKWRSAWQIANTLIPFACCGTPYRSLDVSYWLTLLLAVPTGFLVRAFIIFHDCCHGSFFKTVRANDAQRLLGVLAFALLPLEAPPRDPPCDGR
jgi:omega-6 fatty acid desaturase (delta-12 desaturase)